MTREPGNLLPVIVTRKRVGRGAPVSLIKLYHPAGGEGGWDDTCGDISAIALGRQLCHFFQAMGVLRPMLRAVFLRHPLTKPRPRTSCGVPVHRWLCSRAFRPGRQRPCRLKPRRRRGRRQVSWAPSLSRSPSASRPNGRNPRHSVHRHQAAWCAVRPINPRRRRLRHRTRPRHDRR